MGVIKSRTTTGIVPTTHQLFQQQQQQHETGIRSEDVKRHAASCKHPSRLHGSGSSAALAASIDYNCYCPSRRGYCSAASRPVRTTQTSCIVLKDFAAAGAAVAGSAMPAGGRPSPPSRSITSHQRLQPTRLPSLSLAEHEAPSEIRSAVPSAADGLYLVAADSRP